MIFGAVISVMSTRRDNAPRDAGRGAFLPGAHVFRCYKEKCRPVA